jgi:hypothetical protein
MLPPRRARCRAPDIDGRSRSDPSHLASRAPAFAAGAMLLDRARHWVSLSDLAVAAVAPLRRRRALPAPTVGRPGSRTGRRNPAGTCACPRRRSCPDRRSDSEGDVSLIAQIEAGNGEHDRGAHDSAFGRLDFRALLGPGAGGANATVLTVSMDGSSDSSHPSSRAASMNRRDCSGSWVRPPRCANAAPRCCRRRLPHRSRGDPFRLAASFTSRLA